MNRYLILDAHNSIQFSVKDKNSIFEILNRHPSWKYEEVQIISKNITKLKAKYTGFKVKDIDKVNFTWEENPNINYETI